MLHCNCSFKFAMHHLFKSSAWRKTECKHEKIRISWNIRGFCVWLYNSIPHFSSGSFSTTFEWISRKTVDGKEAIRKRRPQCFTHSRLWNEFFQYDFVLQEAGNARSRELEPWRKMDADCSFDLRGEIVWFRRKLCVVQLFSTLSTLLWWMFSSFQIFNFFQPFSTFFNFFS
jgi:hypothetical protein